VQYRLLKFSKNMTACAVHVFVIVYAAFSIYSIRKERGAHAPLSITNYKYMPAYSPAYSPA